MDKFKAAISRFRKSDSSFFWGITRYLIYKIAGKNILANNKVIIKGLKNITTKGLLQIGINYVGFMHKHDITYLNVNGKLTFQNNFSIGKGCRFDIGSGAVAQFGNGYVNAKTTFIIMHGLVVGDGCAISWGCEFLDEDFHHIIYDKKKEKNSMIEIGNHVWIGSNVIVLKGSSIPDGCVVASGSVVNSVFEEKNCLIGGNPAKIIKKNVVWD